MRAAAPNGEYALLLDGNGYAPLYDALANEFVQRRQGGHGADSRLLRIAGAAQSLTLTKYAPAVFVDPATGQAAVFHQDGRPVDKSAPANRDQRLVIYAAGLGPTKGAKIVSGTPTPATPLSATDPVQVFFGDPTIREAEVAVEWSGLTPGFIGLYQVNVYVPWYRLRGDLPVTIRVGGVDTPKQTPVPPVIPVE